MKKGGVCEGSKWNPIELDMNSGAGRKKRRGRMRRREDEQCRYL
jgi:hypothetical protein